MAHRADGSLGFLNHSLDYGETRHLCAKATPDGYGPPQPDPSLAPWRSRLPEGFRIAGGTQSRDGTMTALEVVSGEPGEGMDADVWLNS